MFVYGIIAKNTIEERILELQKRKREIASAVLDGVGGGEELSKKDLVELVS